MVTWVIEGHFAATRYFRSELDLTIMQLSIKYFESADTATNLSVTAKPLHPSSANLPSISHFVSKSGLDN